MKIIKNIIKKLNNTQKALIGAVIIVIVIVLVFLGFRMHQNHVNSDLSSQLPNTTWSFVTKPRNQKQSAPSITYKFTDHKVQLFYKGKQYGKENVQYGKKTLRIGSNKSMGGAEYLKLTKSSKNRDDFNVQGFRFNGHYHKVYSQYNKQISTSLIRK